MSTDSPPRKPVSLTIAIGLDGRALQQPLGVVRLSERTVMCLTIANATDVRDHQDNPPPARGYTRTQHHAGYLAPGDLWRPDGENAGRQRPHTVMAVGRRDGRIILTDQYGATFDYAPDAIIPTAVADALLLTRSAPAK